MTWRSAPTFERAARHKPRKVTVTGTLVVRKDANGTATSAKVVTADGSAYYIVLDAKGRRVADEPDGQRLVIAGHVTDEDGDRLLTVKHTRLPKATAR